MPSAARIRKNQRERKKKLRRRRILIGVFIGILVLFVGGYAYLSSLLGQADQVDIDETDLGIEEKPTNNEPTNLDNDKIINIALFGIDSRENSYTDARSDSIIIATLDLEHKSIKLTSLMRDTYVMIPEEKNDKIAHAYAYGGPTLAIKTINMNYDMNIRDFATVNFEAMQKIVDAIGGVEIAVTAGEAQYVPGISGAGTYLLDGKQAVEYSRIRKIGTDFARTERQRTVLEKVIKSVLKDRSITKIVNFADSLLPYVQTSLTKGEILSLATKTVTSGTSEIKNDRLPIDGHGKDAMINGTYFLKTDSLIDNVSYLHNFIYENDDFEPSERLQGISDTVSY